MCIQNWQTVNKHQGSEHFPSSFSPAEGTHLFFLLCHPSMDRGPSFPPALPDVSNCHSFLSSQHFLSLELLLFLCTTVVLFALAPGWEPGHAFWAAGTHWLPSPPLSLSCCRSLTEQESEISQPLPRGRAAGPVTFCPVTSFYLVTSLANISCNWGRLKERCLQIESVTSSKTTWKIVTIIWKKAKEKKGLKAFCFRIILLLILSYSY